MMIKDYQIDYVINLGLMFFSLASSARINVVFLLGPLMNNSKIL